jgi:23S rRNA (cytidine1920-2'-O)/16S rRNA (cytidine1409-2'-O)-methyltransferase
VHAGRVLVAGAPATSPARQVRPEEAIALTGPPPPFVSRGGAKLAPALDAFAIDPAGRICADIGASTGGFTDCLLQRGATRVFAVDVGRGQLAWTIRNDPRVTVMERTNVRRLGAGALAPAPDLVTVDVSFISLRTIARNLREIARPDADFVLLVKPQFEAGRARVGKGGIVRDVDVRVDVVGEVVAGLDQEGLGVRAVCPSPITGADGNVEYLAHARRASASLDADEIERAVRGAA